MTMYDKIKTIAFRYLDGQSDKAEEKQLLEFISSSKENKAAFCEMEKEWKAGNRNSIRLESMASLEERISKDNRRSAALYSFAAIGAVLILLTSGYVINRHLTKPESPDSGIMTKIETGARDRTKIMLPDGSSVHLNSCSEIIYSQGFNDSDRTVFLRGEALFDVAEKEGYPFVVDLGEETITVRGTRFNVSAYEKNKNISVALIEGKVEFNEGETTLSIEPGEVVFFDKGTRHLSKQAIDADRYCSWTEGRIDYSAVTLAQLFERLSCIYDLDIRYSPEKYAEKKFNIILSTEESIKDILDAISIIIPIKWIRNGNSIIVTEL